jgi:hypothetical protein
MGVAIDTYDEQNGIHPRNKQLVSQRLAWAGLNVAYGQSSFPTNGPFPEFVNFALLPDGYQVDILYDEAFKWNPTESDGFYFCCEENFDDCDKKNGAWQKVFSNFVLPI